MLRLALPTGDLRAPVAAALAAAGLSCDEYAGGSRALRLSLAEREDVTVRVFREKDIPIQIALGNYDLGICSAAWVEELHARFPSEDVTVLRPLAFGRQRLVLAGVPGGLRAPGGVVRIVSEYPGVAEHLARQLRLGRYLILPVRGAAEAYPPEDADLALLSVSDEAEVHTAGLEPLSSALDAPAWLIANRRSLATRDLSSVIGALLSLPPPFGGNGTARLSAERQALVQSAAADGATIARAPVRLALPDGHAQRHTHRVLRGAGLMFDGYEERAFLRRPSSGIESLEIKVIRPQDMPQQVAIGNFDLAITGRDCLMDHLWAFPSSPVVEALDLGLSRYAQAAAVSEDVPADTLAGALAYWRMQGVTTIRIASEFPNIADHFARSRHVGRYRIIPVSGASEAFVPEDSEILIEGTETGSSFRANRLKAIDRVMESTNCVITSSNPLDGERRRLVDRLLDQLRSAVAPGAAS